MKRLLLTGATGFLGAAFRKWYELAGWSVVTLGRDKESDVVLTFDFEALAAQIANHGPFDRIVHSAAVNETQIATSLTDTYTINVTLSRLVAQIAIINKIPEVIYCSTFHVYGKYEGEIDKDFGCRPLNDYGLTHYLSEIIFENLSNLHDINILVLRPTNIFGSPADWSRFNRWSLVPFDFVRQATEAHEIKINNGGDQFRNFVDIRHVVEQEIGSTKFEIRDIYGNMTTTIKEFAQIVAEEVERKIDRTVNVTVRGNTHHSKAAAPFNFQASGYSSYPSLRSFINDCVTAVRAQSTD